MKATSMFNKNSCYKIFIATMYTSDPLVVHRHHYSSCVISDILYTIVVSAFDEYRVAAIQVRLPSLFFVRQYNFILQPSWYVSLNRVDPLLFEVDHPD